VTDGRIYTFADFSGRVGEPAEFQVADHRIPMSLDAAQEVPGSPRPSGGFRLEFVGPLQPALGQGIFPVLFGEERFELFIVPIGQDARGVRYEALFF